jgi:glycosyltransferase involved in cell wall biosynthesis
MRILTLTTLYPNAAAPAHGVFVENRIAAFAARSGAEVKVVAPVPWFPTAARWAGRYGDYARAPARETRRGFDVRHPRYAIPPKVGMTYAAHALERCFLQAARDLQAEGFDFDLIDAHYLYPDGVAAQRAARRLGKPIAVTARGTDVSLIPKHAVQRRMILDCAARADAVICVAAALKDELARLGAQPEKIAVLRNGVDLERFRPLDRDGLRRSMGLSGDVIASVGHLIERKGHHLAIEALGALADATLLIAGAGEERARLERLAAARGVAGRVRFLGPVAPERIAEIYNAADVLALASSREGWPNVLLEAMACGTPVVATPAWGSVEVIREAEAGLLCDDRSAEALARGLKTILASKPSRRATRAYAEAHSWDETSDALAALFTEILDKRRAASLVAVRPARAAALQPQPPRLVVTIDTEEEFDWSRFRDAPWRVSPPEHIDRFQQLARGFGVRPAYLLTTPVIADARASAYFRTLHAKGEADLGLHLHQWTTPPLGAHEGEYHSFQKNLPSSVHEAKLAALADAFEAAFGFRARAHRAGRYGISMACYGALSRAGVDLDFSPTPGFNFAPRGGPDFSGMSNAPFLVEPADANPVAVTPTCGARAIRRASAFLSQEGAAPGLEGRRRALPDSLTAAQRLTCEGAALKDLIALTRRLISDRTPVFVFTFHSTTMTPGGSPYAKDSAGVEAALALCRAYFEFFKSLGGAFLSLDDLSTLYGLTPRQP